MKVGRTSFKAKLWTQSAGDGVDAVVAASVGNLPVEGVGQQGVGDGVNGAALLHLGHGRVLALHHGDDEEEPRQISEKHFLVLLVEPARPTVSLKGLLREEVTSGKGNRWQLQVRPLLF